MRTTLVDTPQFRITFSHAKHAPLVFLPVVRVQFYGRNFVGWDRVAQVLADNGLAATTAWRGGLSFDKGYTARVSNL